MKIAIIGAGIAGLVAAKELSNEHQITLFEASDRVGGHVHAMEMAMENTTCRVDAGFFVFNETYCPHLVQLLKELNVATEDAGMACNISCAQSGLSLHASSWRTLAEVPRNYAHASFYGVLFDYYRFVKKASRFPTSSPEAKLISTEQFIRTNRFGAQFVNQFLLPLAGAIWPVSKEKLLQTPIATLIGFINNHGLLHLDEEPQTRRLVGGTKDYLQRLEATLSKPVELNCRIRAISRAQGSVTIKFYDRPKEHFDAVVMATPADRSLQLLADPTRHERQVLQAFEYVPQTVVLHTDASHGHSNGRRNSAFQFTTDQNNSHVSLTYDVTYGKGLSPVYLTMVGSAKIAEEHILATYDYTRPVFSPKIAQAQRRFQEINGPRQTYFCGAYWGNGFQEDAVRSAKEVNKLIQTQQKIKEGRGAEDSPVVLSSLPIQSMDRSDFNAIG